MYKQDVMTNKAVNRVVRLHKPSTNSKLSAVKPVKSRILIYYYSNEKSNFLSKYYNDRKLIMYTEKLKKILER